MAALTTFAKGSAGVGGAWVGVGGDSLVIGFNSFPGTASLLQASIRAITAITAREIKQILILVIIQQREF